MKCIRNKLWPFSHYMFTNGSVLRSLDPVPKL
uniref:Uncharacterized protein n=1 Tax=Anguilla anguilla TaxID=7936 RepID=A0A0E9QQP4_ANGAN